MTELGWEKINKVVERKEPMWRRKLQNKIKELRKDLSQLESSKEVSNAWHQQTLERKYSIRLKTLSVVIEELKQKIVAIAAKVRRYQERVERFTQIMFQNNQRQFYGELNQEEERCDDDQLDAEESKKFWGDIWSESVDQNRNAKWLKDLLPEEQKRCRKRSRGTSDLLYIDRAVIREVKPRKKNSVMAQADYKKAYDLVPHLWIKEQLRFVWSS